MSAIVGLHYLDGRKVLGGNRAGDGHAVRHCGPDGSGVWEGGDVGLGHRMLHTTPESLNEELPLAKGTLVVTADARIDNREDLIGQLRPLLRPGVVTDSELILAAYQTWGEGCLDHLIGDFAFAIWDGVERRLFCARDHFGVRPFYYHHQPGRLFAFGTEIKALLAISDVPERLNEVRVADFLATMREDAENTIYQDIWRLPAAHALIIDADGFRLWKYYTLAPAQDVPPDATDAEYEARFREIFFEAVRARLRSAFPVGTELSGGMDSSSVTCVARRLMSEDVPLHTFSLIYDDVEACDERPYIEEVLRGGGLTPHYIRGDKLGPLANIDDVYTYLDDGLASGNQHLVWELKKVASAAGVRVVLDGVDGDNVISHGLLYLKELAEVGDWETFAYESKAAAQNFRSTEQRHNFEDSFADLDTAFNQYGLPRLQALADYGSWWNFFKEVDCAHHYFGVKRADLLKRYWRRLIQPTALLRARRDRALRRTPRDIARPLFPLMRSDVAERIGYAQRLEHFGTGTPQMNTVRDVQRQLLGGPRIQTALELTTHASAAHGVEVRHPFFDKRLVEFCLALPPEQSLKDGWTRSILRRSLDVLPEPIRWRVGKAWMASNFERGLYEQDASLLWEHVADLGPLSAYVDREMVDGLYQKGRAAPNIEQAQLARVATLACWLKKKFQKDGVGEGFTGSDMAPQAHTIVSNGSV